MKQADFPKCHICGNGMMKSGAPFFYKVKVVQFVFNFGAIQRQHGLEMSMGKAAPLARIVGPDEDIAVEVGGSEVCVCADHLLDLGPFMAEKSSKEITE